MVGKLLFVKNAASTFVQRDEDLLRQFFDVRVFFHKGGKGVDWFISMLHSMVYYAWNIRKVDLIVIWFADYHALVPVLLGRLFRKKTYLIIGGHEADIVPEIKYGPPYNKFRAFFTRYSIRYADYVLPVAEAMKPKITAIHGAITGSMIATPTGYDPTEWYCDTRKEKLVVTAAHFHSLQRLRLKGLDFFVRVAYQLPAYQFVIIGGTPEGIRELGALPANLRVYRASSTKELQSFFSRAKVYAQFSLSEGFPNALCEAMLCECVPVGTQVAGIPAAIGDAGYLISRQDEALAVEAVRRAMESPDSDGLKARNHILENFNITHRAELFRKFFGSNLSMGSLFFLANLAEGAVFPILKILLT